MRTLPLLSTLLVATVTPGLLWADPFDSSPPPCLSPDQTEDLRTRALASALLPVLVANGHLVARTRGGSPFASTRWNQGWSVGVTWQIHKAWQPLLASACSVQGARP